jgi:hypothetical protein
MMLAMLAYVFAIVWGSIISLLVIFHGCMIIGNLDDGEDVNWKFHSIVSACLVTGTIILWWAVWALSFYIPQ